MDTVSVRGVFTEEANIECDQIINSGRNLLSPSGSSIRTLKNEGILGLYELTKGEI